MQKFVGLLSLIAVSLAPVSARAEILNLDILANWVPVLSISDQATDQCWTNVKGVQNIAELSLRRAFSEVAIASDGVFETLIKQNKQIYIVEISSIALRSNMGVCFGSYTLHVYYVTMVRGVLRPVTLHMRGGIGTDTPNLNEVVRSSVQEYLDELALEVLRYRSTQN